MRYSRVIAISLFAATAHLPLLAAPLPVSDEPQPYTIINQDVRSVLADFSESLNIPISISDGVEGAVRQVSGSFTPEDFMHHLALNNEFSWYYDGRTLHVTPLVEEKTILLQMGDVSVEAFNRTLEELQIADARYPVIMAGEQGLARVSGPPRYIELLQETFQAMSPPVPATEGPRNLTVIQGGERVTLP